MRRFFAAGALAALILGGHSVAVAQTVRGEVVEAGSGRPIAGAFVVLVDGDGARRAGALSDAAVSTPLQLAAGETLAYRLAVPAAPIALEGIRAEAAPRCAARPDSGAATAALWEEARKALDVTAWEQRRRRLRYTVSLYERGLDPRGRPVGSERVRRKTELATLPFASLPAAELAAGRYVQGRPEGTFYYAPDADVLLSDAFLDGHCFQVERGEGTERGLIGLAFEPVERPGRTARGRTEIEGVLWLDRASAELRSLEYRYRDVPHDVPTDRLGGRVEFDRLPDGSWIVRRWWVRMPIVETRRDRFRKPDGGAVQERKRSVLTGLREEGGEVVAVRSADGLDGSIAPLTAAAGAPRDSVNPVADTTPRQVSDAAAVGDSTILLEPLRVTARARPRSPRLREFYARAERGSTGYFVTREQIEERRGRTFSDLLRGVPNLYLAPLANGEYGVRMNRNAPSITDADCPPVYYLDGILHPIGCPDQELRPGEIEGIEVYAGSGVPAQFAGSRARCGVILVWTRER